MPSLFSRLKGRDGRSKKNAANDQNDSLPQKPKWDDAYTRKSVEPEEIHQLLHFCTEELKSRALDHPFLVLPFRPTSDPSAVRTFIRHFFDQYESMTGEKLAQELRLTEPMVITGVVKWCWSRIQGGVVGWDAYELFKIGELDSNKARDSFKTFIPISVENGARQRIIFDFFDLLAAMAAHGKTNGLGGRKLSRLAAWWAFEHKDTMQGFQGGYDSWSSAADATSHLFFAYLRSLTPEQNVTGISLLPRSLQKLLQETEYPPPRPELMMTRINKVVMVVDTVSPTPFSLLRRANHFQYRDSDKALQEFSDFDDPIQALTDECRRVLKSISGANQSHMSSVKHSTSLRDASWSRFEDVGFGGALEEEDEDDESAFTMHRPRQNQLRSTPASGNGLARPTTPSWADFLSSGFVDDNPTQPNLLLPPDKVLPPIDMQTRQRSSQSHRPRLESDSQLEPGELASLADFDFDDAFWWVWMSSLAPEETPERKAAFGRCAVIETKIRAGRWLVMEEMVAGAAPEPQEGAYIAEKKSFFSWTRRGKTLSRHKSTGKSALERQNQNGNANASKASVGPDTHARIQAKAAQLRAKEDSDRMPQRLPGRRGRSDAEVMAEKTNSVMTLQPMLVGEASSAMKWVNKYDNTSIKGAYMNNNNAGRGMSLTPVPSGRGTPTVEPYATPEELPPRVPAKEPTAPAPPPPVIQAPEPPRQEVKQEIPKRKMIAPRPEQPAVEERKPVETQMVEPVAEQHQPEEAQAVETPMPAAPVHEEPATPAPPPKDVAAEEAPLPETNTPEVAPVSPERKKRTGKLHKDLKERPAGFRKLFARKNRTSKLPENASGDLKAMGVNDEPTPETPAQQMPTPAATPEQVRESQDAPTTDQLEPAVSPNLTVDTPTTARPDPPSEPSPMEEDLSRVNTADADEASKEFARFDQGPLADQPAFVPDGDEDEDDEDDATPPPIARHSTRSNSASRLTTKHTPDRPEEKLSQSAGPGVQDRWAQIRKAAAERAAQRQSEEHSRGGQSKTTDGDDDTSGEETIESRVARIKARVAELTGNMEGVNGPGSPGQRASPGPRQGL